MLAKLLVNSATSHLFLFSTHITRNKIIAGVVILVVVVVALAAWLVMRGRRKNA